MPPRMVSFDDDAGASKTGLARREYVSLGRLSLHHVCSTRTPPPPGSVWSIVGMEDSWNQ